MEKEVNTLSVKAEWIVDIYQGETDFDQRFIRDPQSSTHTYSGLQKTVEGYDRSESYNAWESLWDWKKTESIADLIPVTTLPQLNPDNPELMKPVIRNN